MELITLRETEKEKAGARCQKAVWQFLRTLVISTESSPSPPRHSPNRKANVCVCKELLGPEYHTLKLETAVSINQQACKQDRGHLCVEIQDHHIRWYKKDMQERWQQCKRVENAN